MRTLAILFLIASNAHASINSDEKVILDHLTRMESQVEPVLKKSIEINSGSLNLKGVRAFGRYISSEFETLGLKSEWIDLVAETQRAGHLFLRKKGSGPKILIIGHLDTVFEPNHPFQKYTRDEKFAYGPGINDMKGGIVAVLFALKALKESPAWSRLNISIALMGDEEDVGEPQSISRRDLISEAKDAKIALGFEYSVDSLNFATIARRGYTRWRLEVKSKPAHSSLIFSKEVGSGANYAIAKILNEFEERLSYLKNVTINPGILVGATSYSENKSKLEFTTIGKRNVVAGKAMVEGDLRTLSLDELKTAKEKMRSIVGQARSPVEAEVQFVDENPPMAPKKQNRMLLARLSEVSVDLGFGSVQALDPTKRGAADISYVSENLPSIDGLGLLGSGAHTSSERIQWSELMKVIKRTAIFLSRLSGAS